MDPLGVVLAAVAVVASCLLYLLGRARERARQLKEKEAAADEASLILRRAREEADNLRRAGELQAKEEAYRLRAEVETEEARRRGEWEAEEGRRREDLKRGERRLGERSDAVAAKADALDRKSAALESRATSLEDRKRALEERRVELDRALADARARLEETARLSAEEAKDRLVEGILGEAKADAANRVRAIRDEALRVADREAKSLIATAIQRMAGDETAQLTVSVVQLPSDDMKGRIIGREGRNVRAFEQATGIDVVIDDTPEAVVLSGFNPVRREVARVALAKLVEDGRIHPSRIEETVAKSQAEVDASMREAAEELLYELGIHDVHAEIAKVLGRLKYRTSFGQSQLAHAREVALLAGNLAAEMGLDVADARRAGVLHDVGKGLTHEQELTHVELGHRLCKRFGEPDVVLNAIKAHHDEEPHRYPEAWLVTAADAISSARPGARREMMEGYVKRLRRLEEIATERPGVERCFAVQAGRELRVMVQPDRVSDEDMDGISDAVARAIEEELRFPGQIKVVVVRETRSVDFAR